LKGQVAVVKRRIGISVIIPTLTAGPQFAGLIESLRTQTLRPDEVLVVDSESIDGTANLAASLGCIVHVVLRRRFDHGGSRNLGAEKASGGILVFLTQDALPNTPEFLSRLTAPIREGRAAAAYARQIPSADATPSEAFARLYNYPPQSSVRHISKIDQRTLRTFFFSNAASAVSRAAFDSVGGFPAPVPTNEDMLLCARLLDAGQKIEYVADAEVIHSHNFSLAQVFWRYLRIGVVVEEYRETLRTSGNSSDGFDFVRQQLAHLWRSGHSMQVPRALAEAITKAFAYRCGRAFRAQGSIRTTQTIRSVVRS
jgi:rhamnosyltransferase